MARRRIDIRVEKSVANTITPAYGFDTFEQIVLSIVPSRPLPPLFEGFRSIDFPPSMPPKSSDLAFTILQWIGVLLIMVLLFG